jgi:HEAT repeat protein
LSAVAGAGLFGLALRQWAFALLAFLDLQGGRIQTLADLVQLLIWAALAGWFIVRLWQPAKGDAPQITSHTQTSDIIAAGSRSVAIGNARDVTINTGDRVEVSNYIYNDARPPSAEEPADLNAQIQLACRRVSERLANILLDGRPVIAREAIRQRLNRFLTSHIRYCFVLGGSGVGKSTFMGVEAQRLLEEGWTVLLVRGDSFTLNNLVDAVRHDFAVATSLVSWQQIVNAIHEGPQDVSGFALLIDAVNDGDPEVVARELALLHDSLGDTDPQLFKVIVSCKDADLNRLLGRPQAPAYEEVEATAPRVGLGYYALRVGDFTADELNDALRVIGATELLTPGRFGERVDPHIATVRDLLKHPATFEHYAQLHLSGNPASVSNLTWGGLIGERLQKALSLAARQCAKTPEELRNLTIAFAGLCRERNAREALLDGEEVRGALPDLFIPALGSERTPYEALMGQGVLVEQPSLSGRQSIGFRITDAAGYLISFEMERQSASLGDDEFRALVAGWVVAAWDYSPLLDGVLALADRLSERPREPRLLLLLDVLLEEHPSYSELFRLMRPTIIVSLFELIIQDDSEHIYSYKEAARHVRASEEMLTEVRLCLQDPDARIRELAAELIGIHRDVNSTPTLTGLLEDEEREVSLAAWVALGRIGRPALDTLLGVANDSSQPAESRRHCVSALRAVGFRDGWVSAAVARCLEDAEANRDTALLQSTFLTAAHLRDRGHTAYAIRALEHEDNEVVHAAAKLLTEVPDPAAFDALRQALCPQLSPAGETRNRRWLHRQLMDGLVASDRERAQPVILEMIREGLGDAGELRPVEALEVVEMTGFPAAYSLALEDLVERLGREPNQALVWWGAELLGKTWVPEQLAAMVESARRLDTPEPKVARLFVNALTPNMREHDEFPTGNGLNRVKDLYTPVKCHAANFVAEAGPLLAEARALSTIGLCELLWAAGDVSAEPWLLHKLEHPTVVPERVRLEKHYIMRALGTCGTRRSLDAVLDYVRQGQEISIYFPRETLYPLLRREVLSADALAAVARDPSANVYARAACLIALGIWDVRAHQWLFADVAREATDAELQRQAVRLLGFGEDVAVIPYLRGLLRNSPQNSVKAEAAEALARLNARQAVHDIERALEVSHDPRYALVLARFGEESSLDAVLDTLRTARPEALGAYLEALAAFSHFPRGTEAVRERFEGWTAGEPNVWDTQTPLIRGLARHNPALLLENVNRLYDEGLLNSGARTALASRIPRLFRSDAADRTLLRELVSRLLCDRDVQTRDVTVHSLRRTSGEFCSGMYEALSTAPGSDEWSRACAVYALGAWGGEDEAVLIESLRYDSELLVRRAADDVVESMRRHRHLQTHLERFNTTAGLSRLSSYLCLRRQGTASTIWSLHDAPEEALTHTFVRYLTDEINKRLKEVYRERQEADKKLDESRGTVRFS